MDAFYVDEGCTVLDVGCGPGAFLESASERVGSAGKVIGIDIQEPFIRMALHLVSEKGLANVTLMTSREDGIPLEGQCVDIALLVTTMHELEGRDTLDEINRVMKKGGVIGVIEWEKQKTPIGPPVSERMGQDEAEELLGRCGFDIEKVFSIGRYHYGISARKSKMAD